MTLRLFNTLTKTKDVFAPLDAKNVRMYVCGPTVYDFAHIGNARPVIVFDVLFRLLRHVYGDAHVTYVRNITDVDDKINARAAERGISIRELTEETTRIYNEDVAALGNLPPSVTPRATEHIAQMIRIIEQLIAAGHAYAADGHVLFDVSSKADYGKLSRRSLDEMLAGARVEVAPYKKNAMDFVLWKPSDASLPGWDSPWGRGRPGWHIECSAMAGEYLGETFDIHGGGIDLQFPHHENEIAQSEGAHHGHPLAKVWMHNGFLQVEGEKMSKSLGNFFTIRDLLADWPGEVLRFNMLRTHYRQPIDWTVKGLEESRRILDGFYNSATARLTEEVRFAEPVLEALCDDLNTPRAIAELHALDRPNFQMELGATLNALGFTGKHVEDKAARIDEHKVNALIQARLAARAAKNWAESDRLRAEIDALGVTVMDNKDGTTSWEVKR
ncbi:MAG TPA: cysteine--tRNA ligase [Rhizomicrobium sp.]|nr:cysteine--tRNA ligase [Rhizomicrobium sp.]